MRESWRGETSLARCILAFRPSGPSSSSSASSSSPASLSQCRPSLFRDVATAPRRKSRRPQSVSARVKSFFFFVVPLAARGEKSCCTMVAVLWTIQTRKSWDPIFSTFGRSGASLSFPDLLLQPLPESQNSWAWAPFLAKEDSFQSSFYNTAAAILALINVILMLAPKAVLKVMHICTNQANLLEGIFGKPFYSRYSNQLGFDDADDERRRDRNLRIVIVPRNGTFTERPSAGKSTRPFCLEMAPNSCCVRGDYWFCPRG